MFIETIGDSGAVKAGSRRLLSLFIGFAFALTMYASKAQAQIIDDLEVNIPFQFHAGNAKLPAGEYRVHVLDGSDLTLLEISSVDGSTSALFQVEVTDAKTVPTKSELIFNKYGNRYFLSKVFEEGSADGSQVAESRYEKTVSQQTMEAQQHVPAHRRTQNGK